MVVIWGLGFYVYGICNFRKYPLSIKFVLPVMALTIFLMYQSCSEIAIKYKAVNINAYKAGIVIIALIVVSSIILFKFSVALVGVVVLSILFLSAWGWMIHRINLRIKTENDWEKYTKWIFSLPIMIFLIVAIIVCIQMLHINS